MPQDIEAIGQLLKQKRIEKNFSLKEIASATSIREKYLDAIEQGMILDLLSTLYAQSFLKQYAEYLGLNLQTLIENYPRAFRSTPEKHEFHFGIGTLETRSSLGGGVKWLPNLLFASGIAAAVVIGYYIMKFFGAL